MTPPLIPVRRLWFALAATVVSVSACGGDKGPVEPPAPSQIAPVAASNNQEAAPGAPLPTPISVQVTAGSAPVAGVTVSWQVASGGGTVSPTTSVTNISGIATTNWTLGPSPGPQTVTASIGGLTTTITATAISAEACMNLEVGGVCLATPSQARSLQLPGGAAGRDFVAIVFYDGNFARNSISVSAAGTDVSEALGPPRPDRGRSFSVSSMGPATPQLVPSDAFKRRIREMEERELVPRLRGWRAPGEAAASAAAASLVPAPPRLDVGDMRTFNVNPDAACDSPQFRQAVVRHESANTVFFEDTQNPAGGFTASDWPEIAEQFEQHIWPVDTGAFGKPTDIDGDTKVLILYTSRVNELTLPGSGSFVGGFFFSRDLFRKGTSVTESGRELGACPASNEAEMFYMLAPDPSGTINNNTFAKDFVKRVTLGTIAHELQHLINTSARLHMNAGALWPETVWLDEGLSHIAEELVYFKASGLPMRSNLDSLAIVSSQTAADAFDRYQRANTSRFRSYLQSTRSQSPYGETNDPNAGDHDDLQTRGAIWSFLRWAADRQASDGDIWHRLVNGTPIGAENLRAVFGSDIGSRFREWAAAHYLDDLAGFPAEFQHRSWGFRSVVPRIVSEDPRGPYPLNVLNLRALATTLVDGGAAYYRFGVAANATATVSFTSGGGQLPSGTSVWIARTR